MARRLLALGLGLLVATTTSAQRVRVDGGEDGEGGRVVANPVTVLQHAILLQHQLEKAQKNLLFVFQDEWSRIQRDDGETTPERAAQLGVEIKGHLRLLNGLQGQLTSTYRLLQGTDPTTWPTALMLQFSELERELDAGRRRIDEGLAGIAPHVDLRALGEVVLREPEPVEPEASAVSGPRTSASASGPGAPIDAGPTGDPDEPPVPEEAEAVGERILSGELATTHDVVTVFERLPGAPRGSLEALLRHATGR